MMLVVAAALVIVAVLILATRRHGDLRVERSVVINALPQEIFPLIDDLEAWEAWTPYDRDPLMQGACSDPSSGIGAMYAWAGNRKAGQGCIAITRSVPYSRVCFDLNTVRPFRGHNKVVFSLHPDMDGTRVSWTLHGKTPVARYLISAFVNLDRKIGGDFELGLSRLKNVVESAQRVSFPRTGYSN